MKTIPYKITSSLIRFFSKSPRIFIPDTMDFSPPLVFIANHERLAGPIMMDTYFPIEYRPWVIDQMLVRNKITEYVAETYFEGRLKLKRGISRVFAGILAPLIENVFNSIDPIPVFQGQYHVKETFQLSLEALLRKQNLLIFPEKKGVRHPDFQHVYTFNTGFLYLARQYFREVKQNLRFVPVAINPNLNTIVVGTAIEFNPHNPYQTEKNRLSYYLMTQIDRCYLANSAQ